MKSRLSQSLLALVSLTFVTGLVAQEYAIKLSRPSRIGLKRHVTPRCTEREEQTFVVPGRTNRTENTYDLDFAAEAEDVEVDAKGHVTKASFTLENCLKTSKQGREQLFPKGTVVVASSRQGRTVFSTQGGQPIPPAAGKVLSAAISVPEMKVIQSELTARLAGAFPVDPSRQPMTQTMEVTMKMVMSGKVGPQHLDGVARMSSYRKAELKFSYPAE